MDEEPLAESLEQSRSVAAQIGTAQWQLEVEPILEVEELPASPPPAPEPRTATTRTSRLPRLMPNQTPALETPPAPERILEALLFVGGPPLTLEAAGQVIRGFTPDQIRHCFDQLNWQYRAQNRPYLVQLTDAGYVLTERPSYRTIKEKLFGGPKEARLSQAALDVLSLIAYRQPISKADLDSLRGSDCASLLRQLLRLGLLLLSREADASQPATYQTTSRFLELFGLASLSELPRLGESIR
jgi:segregation and condensation protein B